MGQMLSVVFALILLGVTILSVNKNTLNHGVVLNQTEIGIYAVSTAASYIQRASRLRFDERTINAVPVDALSNLVPPTTANVLTTPGSLGPDPGEMNSDEFDDCDDFNLGQSTIIDTAKGVDIFNTTGTVYYINPNTLSQSGACTYFKQVNIKTWGTIRRVFEDDNQKIGRDTIQLSYIYSYYR